MGDVTDMPPPRRKALRQVIGEMVDEIDKLPPEGKPYPVEFWKELDFATEPGEPNWLWSGSLISGLRGYKQAEYRGRRFFYQFVTMLERHPELVGRGILYDLASMATRYPSGHVEYKDVIGRAFFEELEKLLLLKVECFNPYEREPE